MKVFLKLLLLLLKFFSVSAIKCYESDIKKCALKPKTRAELTKCLTTQIYEAECQSDADSCMNITVTEKNIKTIIAGCEDDTLCQTWKTQANVIGAKAECLRCQKDLCNWAAIKCYESNVTKCEKIRNIEKKAKCMNTEISQRICPLYTDSCMSFVLTENDVKANIRGCGTHEKMSSCENVKISKSRKSVKVECFRCYKNLCNQAFPGLKSSSLALNKPDVGVLPIFLPFSITTLYLLS